MIQGERYLWKLPTDDNQRILQIASTYNLSFPIAQTLLSRGFETHDAINSFLFSSFERDVAHPSLMKDMQKAVDRIEYAISQKEPMLVFGDYDVDGITSSALMMTSLLPLGAHINFFLPHRVRDGYGISASIVERAAKNNYKVIITVDNGITAFEPALKAKECGVDLIITDHHRPHNAVPDAFAVVNPNQDDCPYPFKTLAGVGVTFKLISLIYERKGLPLPPKVYELLLLGTIADVVPLLGENRFWVRHGLHYINSTESLSFNTLKQNGKIVKKMLSATDIGFGITPQINALGRLQDPRQGVKFLIGTDVAEVQEVGRILLELNEARKEIERSIFNDVEKKIDSGLIDLSKENVIIATSNQWPPGVIGLVASRLVSKYGKPTLLFHETKEGILKGSCRSIPEFSIFDALVVAKEHIMQFGGHSQAAGLSLAKDKLTLLKASLEHTVSQQLTPFDLQQKIEIDAIARLSDLSQQFMRDMNHLEPFGHHNRQPTFMIKDLVLVQQPQLLKELHVKCSVFADGVIKPIIFFNRPDLYEPLKALDQESFTLAAQVQENHWNGRVSVELNGVDIAKGKA
jgi:single-stranded-DNA-specific exonuclease RecJ